MNKIMKLVVAVCVIGITIGTAYARPGAPLRGPVGYHHAPVHVVHHHCPPPRVHVIHPGHHHHHHHHHKCDGSAIIGGIIGGIIGTIVR